MIKSLVFNLGRKMCKWGYILQCVWRWYFPFSNFKVGLWFAKCECVHIDYDYKEFLFWKFREGHASWHINMKRADHMRNSFKFVSLYMLLTKVDVVNQTLCLDICRNHLRSVNEFHGIYRILVNVKLSCTVFNPYYC